MQEMKRRYLSMYVPNETVDDQFNEHCGVCDEQGIEEAKPPRKLAKRDVGMECMECGNKFRAKLSTLQYGKTKCPKCKSTDLDFAYGESVEEEVEIEEEFWAVIDKAKGGEVMAVSSDEKGAKSSVKMSNFSKHDYHFNKDPRTLKIVKVAGSYKKGEKMIGTKLSFKEEVEVDESNELQAIMALDDVGIEATINKKDQVVVKKKDLKKAEAALKKSFRKGGAPELHGEEVEIGEKIEKESYGSFITAAAKAKKEGKKTFMMGGKKYPVTIKQKISAAYEETEVEEAKLYAAKGTAYPATIDTLKMIVREKQNQTVMFKSGQAIVDLFTASAMVQVYDALKKPEMKKTFEKMIGDKAGFLKTQAFAMKMISGGK